MVSLTWLHSVWNKAYAPSYHWFAWVWFWSLFLNTLCDEFDMMRFDVRQSLHAQWLLACLGLVLETLPAYIVWWVWHDEIWCDTKLTRPVTTGLPGSGSRDSSWIHCVMSLTWWDLVWNKAYTPSNYWLVWVWFCRLFLHTCYGEFYTFGAKQGLRVQELNNWPTMYIVSSRSDWCEAKLTPAVTTVLRLSRGAAWRSACKHCMTIW